MHFEGERGVYVRGAGTRICVGPWVQFLFTLIGFDDVVFSSPDDKVCELNCVGYVLVVIQGKIRICTHALVDDAGDETDGIFITEEPDFISVSTGESLNVDRVIYCYLRLF